MTRRRPIPFPDPDGARPLDLRRKQILTLAANWGDSKKEDWDLAWRDLKCLAARFLGSKSPNESAIRSTWHHLLLAAGNFKRSGGLILPLSEALDSEPERSGLSQEFAIPGESATQRRVACRDAASWSHLTNLEGLGVPTATTVLSALWPDDHAIIDRRDTTAATALGAPQLWDRLDYAKPTDNLSHTEYWRLYGWFRRAVLATAKREGCKPVCVERALFVLDRHTKTRLRGGSWEEYRAEMEHQLRNGHAD
jgi:hypothetical protein